MHGKKLGRTIGFPTANIHLPHLKPALQGVFVVEVDTPGGRLGGVASLGLNPTVSDTPDYKLEVHLFDFSGDLYGQRLTVRFLKSCAMKRAMMIWRRWWRRSNATRPAPRPI